MSFGAFVRNLMVAAVFGGAAIALLAALALALIGDVGIAVDLDVALGRFDGLWLVALLPAALALSLLLASPLAFVLQRAAQRLSSQAVG